MKKLLLITALLLTILTLFSCGEKPMPTKIADIPSVTKGYFGENTPDVTIDLAQYVAKNEAEFSYTVTSSDENAVTATLSGETLTVAVKSADAKATVTVGVVCDEEEVFTLPFEVSGVKYAKIACIGDSLTYGHTWPKEAYPVYLAEILGDEYEVGSFGRNGASICGYNNNNYVDTDVYTQSLEFDADIAVIMLGTNDAKTWDQAEAEFIERYTALIDSYKANNPDIRFLIVTAPPTEDGNAFSIPNDVIRDKICPKQRELVQALGLPMLDFRDYMENADGGSVGMLREGDGVHLTVMGSQTLAQLVAEKLYEF